MAKADLIIESHGTIFLLRPITAVAREWLEENVASESWQWSGDALSCQPRYVAEIVNGARESGLQVR